MKKKGIRTERGDINRKVHKANRVLREIRNKINGLKEWMATLNDAMKEYAEEDRSPTLSDLMLQYLEMESQRVKKYSGMFQLKHYAELTLWNTAHRFLHAKGISPADLPDKMAGWQAELNELSAAHDLEYSKLKQYREEVKELDAVHRQSKKALLSEDEQKKYKKRNKKLSL